MSVSDRPLTEAEVASARIRRLEAMRLQEIEGNPLDAEDIAMFEMFEREAGRTRSASPISERARRDATSEAAE